MVRLEKYRGVIPAFYACYDDRGAVNEARTRRLARHLVDKGVKGLYVGGSSGECIYLEKEERMRTLEAVMQEVGGQCTVIAHVACNNTEESCQLAAHAEGLGVDAIASIPPIYFHLPDAAIARYWNDISDAAPHTDFFIYNIPQLAGVALSIPLIKRMQQNPRVVGVKNSSMPVYDIEGFRRAFDRECILFNGPDEQFVAGRAIGADGGIGSTYNMMGPAFVKLYNAFTEGRFEDARQLQFRINRCIEIMLRHDGCMKQVLSEGGIDVGKPAFPGRVYTREEMRGIMDELNRVGYQELT